MSSLFWGKLEPFTALWRVLIHFTPQHFARTFCFCDQEATFRIPACEAVHRSKYTCQVLNEAGQDKCFASLDVRGTFASCSSAIMCTHIFHCFRTT